MNRFRFEKFEMKYGYFLPDDFKKFMAKFGGDCHFGSCNFDYVDNIINNLVRVYGKMDFHLFPFGSIGNGDYYCFYRYGENKDDYFVGIWLHETKNFIILCKTFKAFIYRCILDDYFSTIVSSDELGFEESVRLSKESIERCNILCSEYNFDMEKVKTIKNQIDYHRLMIEFDPKALQSLCYLGKHLINSNMEEAKEYLTRAKNICSFYTAPYYILGKHYLGKGINEGKTEILKGIKTSLILTGYSYWEEDYMDIPQDVHRNLAFYLSERDISFDNFIENALVMGRDPYSLILRLELAERLKKEGKYNEALREYANAIYCCDDNIICKDILREALNCTKEGGIMYLSKLIEQDIKLMK
ncbi:SMI1/KNR4 family protein [Clostridium cylindrosporum]|uniref:Knr4/Smi1-like domain-containing protein n=1 Tax=Clostridium cylindrosporum DSM 605 TaxID=1121307 RepID=A0A0J8FYZ6_CLOCY|nr:SMI1/KNR4 family protein [Clostridium cylindrosporum]KMT20846.1 hypothetical protein CLCY_1c00800 [Clostridium cylindrosporum DSM 605]